MLQSLKSAAGGNGLSKCQAASMMGYKVTGNLHVNFAQLVTYQYAQQGQSLRHAGSCEGSPQTQ